MSLKIDYNRPRQIKESDRLQNSIIKYARKKNQCILKK